MCHTLLFAASSFRRSLQGKTRESDVGCVQSQSSNRQRTTLLAPRPLRRKVAFGIAPCGELWAKEFGGGAEVRAAFAYKMAAYTLTLLKKFAARHKGEGFFSLQRGGRAAKNTKMKCGEISRPDLRTTPFTGLSSA